MLWSNLIERFFFAWFALALLGWLKYPSRTGGVIVSATVFDQSPSAYLGVFASFGSHKFFGGFMYSVGRAAKMSIDWWLSRESCAPVDVMVFPILNKL